MFLCRLAAFLTAMLSGLLGLPAYGQSQQPIQEQAQTDVKTQAPALGEPNALPRWEIGLGAAALHLPDYRGAEQSHDYLFPVPFVVYRGDRLRVDRGGVRAEIFDTDRVELNLSVGASVPVRVKRNEARKGMPAIDPVFEIGPAMNITLARWGAGRDDLQLRLPVRGAFAFDGGAPNYLGLVFTPHLRAAWRDVAWASGATLRFSTGPAFASGDVHRYYYDVAPQYATVTRPAYRASGGYSAWETSFNAVLLRGRWRLFAFTALDAVRNAAYEESPLVKRRSSFSTGLGVAYVFYQSASEAKEGAKD